MIDIKTFTLNLETRDGQVTYIDITDKIRKIVKDSRIKEGYCLVCSIHTTCSVLFEEKSLDENYFGYEYLQQDLNDLFDDIVPRCKCEGQYHHPGPNHIKVGLEDWGGKISPNAYSMFNTDGHLRSSLIGSSNTFIIENEELQIGMCGYIYFIDWDQTRSRNRECKVQIIGK